MRFLVYLAALISFALANPRVDLAQSNAHHSDEELLRGFVSPDTRVLVLVFVSSDCPICNRYLPELERINREFASHGVAFRLIFPDPADKAEVVAKHSVNYPGMIPIALDQPQNLVRLAHVSVTPEAAVFTVREGVFKQVYHGRIDDRYVAFGRTRPAAAQHDLEDAVKAALSSRAVLPSAGAPVGCAIVPARP